MSLPVEFHTELTLQLHRWLRDRTLFARCEYRLPAGRIADIISIDQNGEISIYEIKTQFKDSLIMVAMNKYQAFCNRLWIVAPDIPTNYINQRDFLTVWPSRDQQPGLIQLGNSTATIIRTARYQHLPAHHAVMLRNGIMKNVTPEQLFVTLDP